MTDQELQRLFNSVDTDGSGQIDYQEFVTASLNMDQLNKNENLQKAFKYFDKDGSGLISPEEIKAVLGFGGNLSSKEIDRIIKECDENEDGEISFDEFVNMMRKLGGGTF